MNERIEGRGAIGTIFRESVQIILEPIRLARRMEARKMGWWSVSPIVTPVALGVLQAAMTRSSLAGFLLGGAAWLAEGAVIRYGLRPLGMAGE